MALDTAAQRLADEIKRQVLRIMARRRERLEAQLQDMVTNGAFPNELGLIQPGYFSGEPMRVA